MGGEGARPDWVGPAWGGGQRTVGGCITVGGLTTQQGAAHLPFGDRVLMLCFPHKFLSVPWGVIPGGHTPSSLGYSHLCFFYIEKRMFASKAFTFFSFLFLQVENLSLRT